MQIIKTGTNRYRVEPDAGERALPAVAALLEGEGTALALALRRAVQLSLRQLTDEGEMCAVASVYPVWEAGRGYAPGEVVRYGVNRLGDAQLYQVLQAHTSQGDWTPDAAASLYQPIGLGADGVPLWVQPLGAADAYQAGDQVWFEGVKYVSTIDNNVWPPVAYPAGWKEA